MAGYAAPVLDATKKGAGDANCDCDRCTFSDFRAVAGAGPIGFIGFLAAYCGRAIEPVVLPRQLLFSALSGALLLIGADILARWLIQPYELPVGTLLAAIGAPVLILVVLRGGFRSLLAGR